MTKLIVSTFCLLLLVSLSYEASIALRGSSPKQEWVGLGDRLLHTFFSKTAMPLNMTSAKNSTEWNTPINNGECVPGLGYGFLNNRIVVYYTKAGQLSGFGVQLHGTIDQKNAATFWKRVSADIYQIEIATRDSSFSCSGYTDTKGGVLGDRLIVAPNSEFPMTVPLTEDLAMRNNYTRGGCISGMGRHAGFDLVSNPHLSGYSFTLMPVIPMYHDGFVSAILFFAHQSQEYWPVGQWEGPFIPYLFCKNFCSDNCMEKESGFSLFSTMHFLFHDPALNTCDNRCPNEGDLKIKYPLKK